MIPFLQKNKLRIYAIIIAIYSLPLHFSRSLPYSYDGGWMTSLNLAIKNHLVFGKDFIFTYGPLGILSTRCNLYVSNWLLLASDLFFLAGCYYFIRRYVVPNKGWFFIALFAMLIFRSAVFSQSLFVIFIIYACLNIVNNFNSYFETGYCAMAGILLFFVKINYGILSFGGLAVLVALMIVKKRRMLLFFLPFAAGVFTIICLCTNIDALNFIKYSLIVSGQYDEAGYWPVKWSHPAFLSGIFMLGVVGTTILYYLYILWKQRAFSIHTPVFLGCISLACFVLYRNGYTRADPYHYSEFFAVFPFIILALVFLCRVQSGLLPKIAVVICMIVSGYNLMLPDIEDKALRTGYYLSYLSPVDYFFGIFKKRDKEVLPLRLLSPETVKMIGNSTIDILPWETEMLHYYDFNYHPRPIPQTCGYAGLLDSLNADFFYKPGRPDIIMMHNFPIDYKYFFWEESWSKASLRLNYVYDTFVEVNGKKQLQDDPFDTYVLLRSKGAGNAFPRFDWLEEKKARLDDTVRISYRADEAIYMRAHFNYNLRGKARRLLFQPPSMYVTLFFDDGSSRYFKASLPSLREPVLINKFIINNVDLKNFYSGNLTGSRNITSFVFHPVTYGFETDYTIEFLKLRNY